MNLKWSKPVTQKLHQAHKGLSGWVNLHTVLLLALLVVFVVALGLSEPLPGATAKPVNQADTPTLTVEVMTATPEPSSEPTETPFPPELLANREQTNGIIFGTVILVLLVIGGTLLGISRIRKDEGR